MFRAFVLTAGVICGFLVAGLAFAGSSARKPRQAPPAGPQPGEAVFVITGRGWGHGVGMSQWGANGFARRGSSYDRILTHYYRGTVIGEAPVAKVRVLLVAGKRSLTVASEAPFRVRDASGETRALPAGKQVIGPGLKIQAKGVKRKVALQGPLTFLPGAEPLELAKRYRGTIQVDLQGRRVRAINVLGLEQYLYGVVPAEVPDDWPAEVLKAQAVAARTYALATRKTSGDFDLFSDVRSQVYRGIDEEVDSTNQAVDETAGEVLQYRGRIVTTYFHSTSGGRTASIVDVWPGSDPVPYLVSVDDPYDSLSPHHTWGPVVVPASRLDRVLKAPGRLTDVRTQVNPSARVTMVTGIGSLGEAGLRAGDVRRELGLRSTWFRVGVMQLPAPAKPLAYGIVGKLTGLARGVGRPVLEQRAGAGWRTVAAVQPQANGTFSVAIRPTTSGQYRLNVGSARTGVTRVGVAPRIALSPLTDPMELRGTVRPALAGATVEIQRQNGGGLWQTVGRATVDPQGEFAATVHIPPGSYRARVPAPGRGLVAGTSSTLVVSR
ncbi:MAG: SpoIID/LytB domain-containing protein [Gaiellales bacterium]